MEQDTEASIIVRFDRGWSRHLSVNARRGANLAMFGSRCGDNVVFESRRVGPRVWINNHLMQTVSLTQEDIASAEAFFDYLATHEEAGKEFAKELLDPLLDH